jgi:ABC-type transporter Mla MlaB component
MGGGAVASGAQESEIWDSVTRPNGDYGIEVFEESDPYMEIAEHAAILFANGQYDTTRSTLESVVKGNNDPGAVKLWAMLFDLLRVRGEQAAFESLSLEFARICELSPPAWSLEMEAEGGDDASQQAAGIAVLQGAVSGDAAVFDGLLQALSKGESRSLDMRRLIGLDSEASAKLAKILQQARRRDLAWGLLAAEALATRLAERTVAGHAQDEAQWLLVLELFQFLGWEEQFEDKAVDYAVTFEVSPPAWEPPKTMPAIQEEEGEAAPAVADDVLTLDPTLFTTVLEGEILQGKLDDVERLLVPGMECRLDFSRVQRIDFVSAGALASLLKTSKAGPVTIVHANRLVAELLRVMGVDQIARVEVARH